MGIIQKMDFLILNWLQKHLRGKTLDILMPMITALGNGGFLFALLTIGLLCTRRWRREGMAVGTSLLLCLLAAAFLFGGWRLLRRGGAIFFDVFF